MLVCLFVKKVIAFWGGDMEVSSVLVEGGVLTHRFFRSQKLTLLIRDYGIVSVGPGTRFWTIFLRTFLIFENHRIDVRGVMIKIKVQFEDSLESIPSASTTNAFSVFNPF